MVLEFGNVFNLAIATAQKLGCADVVERTDVIANTNYVGEAYGLPGEDLLEVIRLFAQLESVLLDAVYSRQRRGRAN